MLVVGSGSSMSAVASKLQKMGLINSKWGIKLLADFTNRSGKVKAGEEDRAAFITSQLSSALGIEPR